MFTARVATPPGGSRTRFDLSVIFEIAWSVIQWGGLVTTPLDVLNFGDLNLFRISKLGFRIC